VCSGLFSVLYSFTRIYIYIKHNMLQYTLCRFSEECLILKLLMSIYLSPALYFPPIPIISGDVTNVITRDAVLKATENDYLLPSDSALQAAGFLGDASHLKGVNDRRSSAPEFLDKKGKPDGFGATRGLKLAEISEIGSGSFDSISAPETPSAAKKSSLSNIFESQVVPEKKQTEMAPALSAQSFDSFSTFSVPNSRSNTVESMSPTKGKSISPFSASGAPKHHSFDAFAPTLADAKGNAVINGADNVPPANGFGDVFSGFDSAVGGAGVPSVKSVVTIIYQEEIISVCRGGNVEKLDYFGTIAASLSNSSYEEGQVEFSVLDPSSQISNFSANPNVVKSSDGSGSHSRLIAATLSSGNKSTPIVKCPFVSTLRPVLFQVRTSVTTSETRVIITLRISLNPTFKNVIENFSISTSLVDVISQPDSTAQGSVKSFVTNPAGGAFAGNSVTWQCARLTPAKQPQLQMEAILDFETPISSSVSATKNIPVILRGGYSSTALCAVDVSVGSIKFANNNICSAFDYTVHKSKKLKFEYKFL
jgi:hypothetical protein